jgi:hypothetical protein
VLAEAAPAAGAVVVVVVVWVLCALSVVVAGAAAAAAELAAGAVVVAGAAADADESAAGAVLEAAGAVLEAEEFADCLLASAAGAIAPPDPEAVESTLAVGCAPLGAAALSFADGTGALLLFNPESVTGAVEFGLEGRFVESVLLAEVAGAAAAEGAAEAPALLQDSAIIFMSATLNLLSVPIVPVNDA